MIKIIEKDDLIGHCPRCTAVKTKTQGWGNDPILKMLAIFMPSSFGEICPSCLAQLREAEICAWYPCSICDEKIPCKKIRQSTCLVALMKRQLETAALSAAMI